MIKKFSDNRQNNKLFILFTFIWFYSDAHHLLHIHSYHIQFQFLCNVPNGNLDDSNYHFWSNKNKTADKLVLGENAFLFDQKVKNYV